MKYTLTPEGQPTVTFEVGNEKEDVVLRLTAKKGFMLWMEKSSIVDIKFLLMGFFETIAILLLLFAVIRH